MQGPTYRHRCTQIRSDGVFSRHHFQLPGWAVEPTGIPGGPAGGIEIRGVATPPPVEVDLLVVATGVGAGEAEVECITYPDLSQEEPVVNERIDLSAHDIGQGEILQGLMRHGGFHPGVPHGHQVVGGREAVGHQHVPAHLVGEKGLVTFDNMPCRHRPLLGKEPEFGKDRLAVLSPVGIGPHGGPDPRWLSGTLPFARPRPHVQFQEIHIVLLLPTCDGRIHLQAKIPRARGGDRQGQVDRREFSVDAHLDQPGRIDNEILAVETERQHGIDQGAVLIGEKISEEPVLQCHPRHDGLLAHGEGFRIRQEIGVDAGIGHFVLGTGTYFPLDRIRERPVEEKRIALGTDVHGKPQIGRWIRTEDPVHPVETRQAQGIAIPNAKPVRHLGVCSGQAVEMNPEPEQAVIGVELDLDRHIEGHA